MFCYKDKTFCASPNCKNECGRQITVHEKAEAIQFKMPVSYAYFCDIPEDGEYMDMSGLNRKR